VDRDGNLHPSVPPAAFPILTLVGPCTALVFWAQMIAPRGAPISVEKRAVIVENRDAQLYADERT
jgi:hypothetical protein